MTHHFQDNFSNLKNLDYFQNFTVNLAQLILKELDFSANCDNQHFKLVNFINEFSFEMIIEIMDDPLKYYHIDERFDYNSEDIKNHVNFEYLIDCSIDMNKQADGILAIFNID